MNLKKSSEILGRDHYRLLYQTELASEAEWLRRGATEKVNSIELLLHRSHIRPQTMLELGCGTGSVITECQRRGLAQQYMGVDYAPEAIDYVRKHSSGIDLMQGDITDPTFRIAQTCDVVVLSHVLEHLEDPAVLLGSMRSKLRFSHAIIEVPLEDLIASRMKAIFRDRTTNKAGHVQFFTGSAFEHLITSNGFKIIDRRTYVPISDIETIRFVSQKDRLARKWHVLKICTNHYLPKILNPLWKRFYYAHHAVLCVPD